MLYQIIQKDGTVKQYDCISKFKEGFAAVRLDGKWGFIDEEGNEICPIKYLFPYLNASYKTYEFRLFSEGYAVIGLPGPKIKSGVNTYTTIRFGYLNTKGEEVCPCIYVRASDFQNGHAFVLEENHKCWLINKNFEKLTKQAYDRIYDFHYGYAVVTLDGKYGFINEQGEEMCEIKYPYMYHFERYSEGIFAHVKLGTDQEDGYYYIDTKGKLYHMHWFSGRITPVN